MSFPGEKIRYLDSQGRDLNSLLANELARQILERAWVNPARGGIFLVNRRVPAAHWLHRTLQELARTGLNTTLVVVSQVQMDDLKSREWGDYSLQFTQSPLELEAMLVYQPKAIACTPGALLGLAAPDEDGGSVGTVIVVGSLTTQEVDVVTAARRLLPGRPWLAVWPGHPAQLPLFALAAFADWTDPEGIAGAVSDAPVVYAHSVATDPRSHLEAAARLSHHLQLLAELCTGGDRILVLCGTAAFRNSLSELLGDAASTHDPGYLMGLSDFSRDGPFIYLAVGLPAFMRIRWRFVVQAGRLSKNEAYALASQMLAGDPRRVDLIDVGGVPDALVVDALK